VVFFHSAEEHLRGYQAQLPFAVVADPDRVQYRRFGVETGLRSVAHPGAWWAGVRGSVSTLIHRHDPEVSGVGLDDGSTHLGLPADFLIDTDGTVAAVHYGQHADDEWSVDGPSGDQPEPVSSLTGRVIADPYLGPGSNYLLGDLDEVVADDVWLIADRDELHARPTHERGAAAGRQRTRDVPPCAATSLMSPSGTSSVLATCW
jgi:hypothetical protein